MAWWPILKDPVGVAGDHSLHAVDMRDARNTDMQPPLVARCGVVVWKVYGVGTTNGGELVMPWPPKLRVARDAYDRATVCADCRTLATAKRPSPSWDSVTTGRP